MSRRRRWTQRFLYISDADWARCVALAGRGFVREAINEWLERHGEPPLQETLPLGRPGNGA